MDSDCRDDLRLTHRRPRRPDDHESEFRWRLWFEFKVVGFTDGDRLPRRTLRRLRGRKVSTVLRDRAPCDRKEPSAAKR